MIKKSRYISCLIFLAFVFGDFAQAQKTFENNDLPNLFQINSNLYRGAQPTEDGVKQLAKMGVKTIIDLRGADELAGKEKLWAANFGIKFINIPLSNWFRPKDEKIEKIIAELDKTENQPVYVHCKRGADRTGTVVAAYRITHENWTAEEANSEAKRFGFGWWQFCMKDYIEDFYKDYAKKTAEKSSKSAK